MPNRILKESICTSESLDQLNSFQENVFYRLIVNCDDFGRMDARLKVLAARLYPLKDIRAEQIENALQALSSAGLVTRYNVGGKPFVQMKTWERHQQIRAKKSKYPAPESEKPAPDSNCNQMISSDGNCPRNPIHSNPIEIVTRAREGDSCDDLLKIAAGLEQLYQAAEGIGLKGATAMQHADRLAADYTAEWVLEAIRRAGKAPKDAWSWRYIEAILFAWRKNGRMDAETTSPEKPRTRKETYTYVKNGVEHTYEREVAT